MDKEEEIRDKPPYHKCYWRVDKLGQYILTIDDQYHEWYNDYSVMKRRIAELTYCKDCGTIGD